MIRSVFSHNSAFSRYLYTICILFFLYEMKNVFRKYLYTLCFSIAETIVIKGFFKPLISIFIPTTPFLHHFILSYTISQTFPFLRTAYLLLHGNINPLSSVMCHVPKFFARFSGSFHIRLLLLQKYGEMYVL